MGVLRGKKSTHTYSVKKLARLQGFEKIENMKQAKVGAGAKRNSPKRWFVR